jgi:stage V sporulation protein SpoVS
LFTDNPELRPNLNEVRTVQGIIDALNIADQDVIQQAASRAGVKPADFLEMFKVQASEAGAFLQQAKSTADMLRKMTGGDPVLEDAFTRMLNAGAGTEYLSGKLLRGVKATTGASVGASTAGLSTAVMNAIGLTGTIGIQTAGDIMEATIKSAGRMVNDLRGGGAPVNTARVGEEIGTIFADGGYVLSRLMDAGYTKELTAMALKNNPRLNNLITNVGAEVEQQGAGAVGDAVRTINIFNRAVDGVVRGPIFLQSVRNRMKDVGLDFEDFMANDKPVPSSLLKAAAEDTMKLTFSYDFKKTGEKSIEGFAEDAAFRILQGVNQNAGAGTIKDIMLPFVRFQLNAARYTYRLTPFSGIGGVEEMNKALELFARGKTLEGAGMAYDAKRKVLDSVVGTAAILGAAAYREENADTQFYQYKDKDGNVKDGSAIFPYVNIMALAEASLVMKDIGKELWYTVNMTPEQRATEAATIKKQADALDVNDPQKQKLTNDYELLGLSRVRSFDGGKFTELMLGMGRSAGTQKTIIDSVKETVEGGISESMAKKGGQITGDFISRFDNFFNPLYDGINFLRDDMRVVDARASTALSGQVSPFTESAIATVAAPIPVARDILQSRPSLFQTTDQQVPTVARQFTGSRPTTPTTPIEKELIRLDIQPFTVVKTTGNRDYDNLRITIARPAFLPAVTELITSPAYTQLSAEEKRTAITTRITSALNESKEAARDTFISRFGNAAVNSLYEKAPNKAAQEDAFVSQFKRKPKTPIEKMMIIEGEFNRATDIGKAKGGLISQTDRMLSKV